MSSLHDVVKNRRLTPMGKPQTCFFSKRILSTHLDTTDVKHQIGGAERDRTADPLLAKQVLSQLSYSPILWSNLMVGLGRLELPTPRLSSVCSNQLSYGP